ncbi:unnamed protein product [Trichogramma brassicae]|uniref:Reverse transcriptase/retrotransposon-derived protein RNase H-like domain-containing protein n=1 Tax=Trichogramma brassicae TaxID=86971 RepID=A0A6H5J3E5_9HYME|nr:unnamed protein product [Trichogramma brassicae]
MEKLRFEFVMKAAADKKSNALMVTSITTPDSEIFDIPAELQELDPLHDLLRKDREFKWTEECQKSFDEMKKILCSQPVLTIFDSKLPIRIYTDASLLGLGAILKQIQENGEEKPVGYFSKKLNSAQKKKKSNFFGMLSDKGVLTVLATPIVGKSLKSLRITSHKPIMCVYRTRTRSARRAYRTVNFLRHRVAYAYTPSIYAVFYESFYKANNKTNEQKKSFTRLLLILHSAQIRHSYSLAGHSIFSDAAEAAEAEAAAAAAAATTTRECVYARGPEDPQPQALYSCRYECRRRDCSARAQPSRAALRYISHKNYLCIAHGGGEVKNATSNCLLTLYVAHATDRMENRWSKEEEEEEEEKEGNTRQQLLLGENEMKSWRDVDSSDWKNWMRTMCCILYMERGIRLSKLENVKYSRQQWQRSSLSILPCGTYGFWYFVGVLINDYKDEPQVDVDGKPLLHHTTPLHRTARHYNFPDKVRIARSLFQIYNRADVNYTDESGLTHFHVACRFGCNNVVEQFLDFGQDPNLIWPETGDSPLHLALDALRTEVAELLLKRGANLTWANLEGLTPLHLLCKRNAPEGLAEMFFQISDDIQETVQMDAQDKYGNAPLHLAVKYRNWKAVEFQLQRGANPNLVNEEGSTPLHGIHESGLAKLFFDVNEELNQSVQVDARDKLGRTPLQLAVTNLLPDVIDVLLDHGADLSSFVFLPENSFHESFGASLKWWCDFLLERVTGALAVVERLENRGYELDLSDVLAIMKFFAKLRLFEKSVDIVEYLNDFAAHRVRLCIAACLTAAAAAAATCDVYVAVAAAAARNGIYYDRSRARNAASYYNTRASSARLIFTAFFAAQARARPVQIEKEYRRYFRRANLRVDDDDDDDEHTYRETRGYGLPPLDGEDLCIFQSASGKVNIIVKAQATRRKASLRTAAVAATAAERHTPRYRVVRLSPVRARKLATCRKLTYTFLYAFELPKAYAKTLPRAVVCCQACPERLICKGCLLILSKKIQKFDVLQSAIRIRCTREVEPILSTSPGRSEPGTAISDRILRHVRGLSPETPTDLRRGFLLSQREESTIATSEKHGARGEERRPGQLGTEVPPGWIIAR